jgi:hypothetical protein
MFSLLLRDVARMADTNATAGQLDQHRAQLPHYWMIPFSQESAVEWATSITNFFRFFPVSLLFFFSSIRLTPLYELVIEIYAPHVRLPDLATLSVLLPFTTFHMTLAHKMLVTRRPSVTSSKHRLLGKLRACRADWNPAHTVFFATLVDLLSDKTPSRNSRSFRGASTGLSSGSRT